jgi:hypothetical protein
MSMATYKAIATITWKFDSDKPLQECLEKAKAQLESIMDCYPHGEDFDGFCVQMDIAPMKERKKLIHLATYGVDEIFPHITTEDRKKEYIVNGDSYMVRMNSDRYFVFQRSRVCVSCGMLGTKMVLDINPGDQSPHFNLYGEENGRLVLMTKDHIVPKSKGGQDALENYQTMCCICNNLKGAYDLSLESCRKLRHLYKNEDKLPRKELRELINTIRDELIASK